jgi:uncharacterized protein YecA (UPF0149 family)
MAKEKRMVKIMRGNGKPIVSQKHQRNSRCACGSGLKAKKCCNRDTDYFVKK